MRSPILAIVIAFVCASVFTATLSAQNSAGLNRVAAALPVVKSLALTTTQPGRIVAYEETPLVSKLSGYVETVVVDIGSRVKKGDLLIRLSIPEMENERFQRDALVAQAQAEIGQAVSALDSAKASVAVAEAFVEEAKAGKGRVEAELARMQSEAKRVEQLGASGAVTTRLVEEAVSQLKAAESGLEEVDAKVRSAMASLTQSKAMVAKAEADKYASEARLQVAKSNLAYLETMMMYREIRAPYDGVVTARNVDTGHFVQPSTQQNQPLLTVARTDMVRVRIDIPEIEASFIDAKPEGGDKATIMIQSLQRPAIQGKLCRSAWSLESANRSLRTEIDLLNPDDLLRPGMYASATILLDERKDVIVLPLTAVHRNDHGQYCCVVEEGKISHRKIETGLKSGSEVEIKSGLTPKDMIVTIRGEGLAEGLPVAVIVPAK